MAERLVIALGGNALGRTPEQQRESVRLASGHMVELMRAGYQIALVHGNGTQVGQISLAFDQGGRVDGHIPAMPFAECNAMSQGYIGFHLQNALQNALRDQGISRSVATVVTTVLVDRRDPAFEHPSKPVGSFYRQEEAERISQERGWRFVEDAGRGYRRVVPSPEPVDICELGVIRRLVEAGDLVIACGGGGIPVCREGDRLVGIDAVIDKDKAAARLAERIHADRLVILTAVPYAAVEYGRPAQRWLTRLTAAEAQRLVADGQFAPGSMLPKIESAVRFVTGAPGRTAIIASLESAFLAVTESLGTVVVSG